ncbi:hypothetical protein L6258_01240 [Candidatus Parcubacteria bacterium]|nr:hypothetical protein [Candidatus Parcubacteria bacterium]
MNLTHQLSNQSIQLIIATVVIPMCLALILIGVGLQNVGWAKKHLPFFCGDFTDGAFLSGQQTGLLGTTYAVLGVVSLVALGIGLWLL